jgi:hypothetical protein
MIPAALKLFTSSHTWWAALAAGLALTNCATGHQRDTARQQLAQLRTTHAQAEQLRTETARLAEAGHRARERTHTETLQAITTKAEHDKDTLRAGLQRTIDSLRNRPERPATAGGAVPQGAADGLACTGAQLFRPDGEFLAREAARADRLRADLSSCQAAYDAAVTLTAPD